MSAELISPQQAPDSNIPAPRATSLIFDADLSLPLKDVQRLNKCFHALGEPIRIKSNQRKTQLLPIPCSHAHSRTNKK